MSDITRSENRKLEKLFGMASGYVLNFSDRTFADFFEEYRINIHDDKYCGRGSSKANKLRVIFEKETSYIVGRVINDLIQHGADEKCLPDDRELINECKKIVSRLLCDKTVAEVDVLMEIANENDIDLVAKHLRDAIEKNQPEAALDRLHTFVIKYIRTLCKQKGIEVSRDKPLHGLFGEYIKIIRSAGHFKSAMTERILKSTISILEAFNDVRNNQSLAHDNPILNYEESLLIFNYVVASMRFIKKLEDKINIELSLAKKDSDFNF